MKAITFLPLLLLPLLAGCFRPLESTVEIAVPQLRTEACAAFAAQSLRGLSGIQGTVGVDLERKVLVVTYKNTQIALKNIERAIALAGFDANSTPASQEARAKLPEGCR